MKGIWKIQHKSADAKINWLTWWYSSRFTSHCTLNISDLWRKLFSCYLCVVYIFSKKWRVCIFQSLECKRLNIKSIEHLFPRFDTLWDFLQAGKGTLWWKDLSSHNDRSTRPQVFYKKGVLRNFTKFAWKRLCQSLSFQRLKPATLLKKRLWHRCFPVNFAKLLRAPFLSEQLRWLLL